MEVGFYSERDIRIYACAYHAIKRSGNGYVAACLGSNGTGIGNGCELRVRGGNGGSGDSGGRNGDLEIGGGITKENVRLVKDAGANVIVAGSTVFKELDRAKIINELRTI